jgi:hypothetical protein
MTKDIDNLLAERRETHGDYADHAAVTQQLKAIFHTHWGWGRLDNVQRETLDMIAHKAGRILSGDPNHVDHWDDIAGYARLVSQRLSPVIATRSPTFEPDVDGKATRAVADALGNGDAAQERDA